ncbi:MAG: FAD-binding oxidoreductase [Chloroflexi bacterium]|nr:FAD-binding oxidoreductase [Chloroflexota bacterium]
MGQTAEVVIIGGGCAGASTAYHLARRGVTGVVLLEKGALASGSTGKSSGIVRQHYSHEATATMVYRALQMFHHWRDIIGGECGFTRCGYLFPVGELDVEALYQNVELQRSIGINTSVVSPDDIRTICPQMFVEDVAAAAYEPDAGYADPAGTTMALAARARELGATILQQTPVTGIAVEHSRIAAVETPKGTISTRIVVNAAGAWAGRIGRMVGVEIPIDPQRHQVITLHRPHEFIGLHPICNDSIQVAYFRPEGPRLSLASSSAVEEGTAANPDGYNQSADPEAVARYSELAIHRFPAMADAVFRGGWSGIYPVTPDGQFILDQPAEGPTGFYLACGLGGHGFKHTPVIGEIIADMILAGRCSWVDNTIFRLSRFREGKPITSRYLYRSAGVVSDNVAVGDRR